MGVYEDNFGFWDINGPEERALFEHVQRQSIYINCERCELSVRLIPPKTLCATCVSALEYGAPSSINEYGYSQTMLLDPRHPHDGPFFPEFGSFVRGEAIAKMSKWRRKGVRRSDLKIIASDPDPAAITKAVEALN
jgi:hypothetical protein